MKDNRKRKLYLNLKRRTIKLGIIEIFNVTQVQVKVKEILSTTSPFLTDK